MKNYKRILMLLMIMFLLVGLVGCSSTNDEKPEDKNPVVDNETDKEDEEDEDEADEEDEEVIVVEEDVIDKMIDDSMYISKVKLITKGQKGTEIKVLDNIKAVVTEDQLPALELKENRVYLVFLKDVDGKVELTDVDNGLVLLEGDNHELFEKINKKVN